MTSRLLTSFKLCLATLLIVAGHADAATVTGKVQLVGSHDAAVKRNGDFSGIAVWLEPIGTAATPAPRAHAVMLQKNKKFSPHILIVSRGSSVDFPNLDPIFHSAFSNFEGKVFDVALYPPGTSRTVFFDRSGVARVFCNIHPTMSAVIVVVNTRFYALTDKEGRFSLSNVPPGEYALHFFHERATPETLAALSHKVSVADESLELPVVAISESGYLPVAHKNKYGRPYETPSDEEQPY